MNTFKAIVHQSDERMLYLDNMLASMRFDAPTHVLAPNISVDAGTLGDIEDGATLFCGRCREEAIHLANSRGITLIDYSKNEKFQAINSRLTAEGALKLIIEKCPKGLADCTVLILGFGRTGAAMARLLDRLDVCFDVATGSSTRPAYALARRALPLESFDFAGYDAVVNTVPSPLVSDKELMSMSRECIYIELASKPAINLDYARHLGIDAEIYPAIPAKTSPYSAALALYSCLVEVKK